MEAWGTGLAMEVPGMVTGLKKPPGLFIHSHAKHLLFYLLVGGNVVSE